MTDYKFPTDIEFRKKAAYIADKVLYAINVGKITIGYQANDYCPLGCLDLNQNARMPNAVKVSVMTINIISYDDAFNFIGGFDNSLSYFIKRENPMYQLGVAYRKRFVK